jgi:hypothetical protein
MVAIYGGSPWTRTAIKNLTPEQLADIAAVLPDDMFVSLGAARSPGVWTIHLLLDGPDGHGVEVARVDHVHDIPNGVRRAVSQYQASAA